MKIVKNQKLYFLSAFLLLIALVMPSCNNDDEDSMEPESEAGTMTADIDDVAWVAETVVAQQQSGIMNVTGTTSTGETLTLTMQGTTATTYDLSGVSPDHVVAYVPETGAIALTSNGSTTNEGEIIVTEINMDEMWMSGTFTCKVTAALSGDSRQVTNGQFTKIPIVLDPGGTGSNELSMKVDGVDWSPTSLTSFIFQGSLTINGLNSTEDNSMAIKFPVDIAVGTYGLDWITDYLGQYNEGTTLLLSSDSGTLNITVHDEAAKHIEGTFDFSAEELTGGGEVRAITEGTFSVDY